MPANLFSLRPADFASLIVIFAVLILSGCSTPGQQLADAEIKALNTPCACPGQQTTPQPYLGSYSAGEPPRLAANGSGYDQFNQDLSDSVAVPFLSFLIIEPDPVTKNGVPSNIEKLVKAKKYPEAIEGIDQLKDSLTDFIFSFVFPNVMVRGIQQITEDALNAHFKHFIEIIFGQSKQDYKDLEAILNED